MQGIKIWAACVKSGVSKVGTTSKYNKICFCLCKYESHKYVQRVQVQPINELDWKPSSNVLVQWTIRRPQIKPNCASCNR